MRRHALALVVCLAGATVAAAQPAPTARRSIRPDGVPADRPYSPGVLVGKTLYIAGHLGLPGDGIPRRRIDLLRYTDVTMSRLALLAPELETIDCAVLSEVAEDAHYAPYIARQEAELRSLAAN